MKKKLGNYAFIDSQNLNLGILDQGWRLDFARFRVYLKDKYEIKKAFLFIGYLPGNKKLYLNLKKFGYEIVFKPTLISGKGVVKGNVDAELVLHTMIQYKNYDKAVIVTGDGDFHCLIEYLEKQKKLAKLLIPNDKKYSALLRRFMGKVEFLTRLRSKLSLEIKEGGIILRTKP